MSSSASFTGAGFFVTAASVYQVGTVRLSYNSAPLALSPLGTNDALNASNYSLSGPGPYSLVSIQPVSGDPLSVDLVFGAALDLGDWIVQVTNVQTPTANPLQAPTAATFSIASTSSMTPLVAGAENDDAEKIIRKHLSTALRGPNWDALIRALSVGDDQNWADTQAAFDQFFLSTASSTYLDRRAGDLGIKRTPNVGMADDIFRRLAITTNSDKVVQQALREILEVYYGVDSSRAFVETDLDGNFNLSGSPILTWIVDEKTSFEHIFTPSQFRSSSVAAPLEVALALTRTMRDAGSRAFAAVHRDSVTGGDRVRIYSGSLGLRSHVRVTGGTAQNVLHFPEILTTYNGSAAGSSWNYTQPTQGITRITTTTSSPYPISLNTVRAGDYVVIGQSAQTGFTGSWEILDVVEQWAVSSVTQHFDIARISFTGSAVQLDNTAYTFYRPKKSSINRGSRTVVVAQTVPGQIDIQIPATTEAVNRKPNEAIYLKGSDSLDISRWVRDAAGNVTITTATNHGLSLFPATHWIQVNSTVPAPGLPYISPPVGVTLAASVCSIVAETGAPLSSMTEDSIAIKLASGNILFAGGITRLASTIDSSSGFPVSGAASPSALCNRYTKGASAVVTNGSEADGALRRSVIWDAAGPLIAARERHAGSEWDLGAMVTGGMSGSSFLSSAEIYNPVTNTWSTVAPMNAARAGHSQIRLNNGYVLVAGGASVEGTATNSCEIFNGSAWVPAASMNVPRTDFQLTKLQNGDLLATGGRLLGRGHELDGDTLALWRLDTAGPSLVDETANNYDLAASGAPTLINAKINGGLDFSAAGYGEYATDEVTTAPALSGGWTAECWFKRASAASGVLIAHSDGVGSLTLDVRITAAGIISCSWIDADAVQQYVETEDPITSSPFYRPNFNHLAVRLSPYDKRQVLSAERNGSTVTLTYTTGHGYNNGDKIAFASIFPAVFSSVGLKTITTTGPTSTTLTYTEAGNVAYKNNPGTTSKNFEAEVFLNGELVVLATSTPGINLPGPDGSLTGKWSVAKSWFPAATGFPGILDDVRISSTPRSQDHIRANYLRGCGTMTSLAVNTQTIGELTETCEYYDVGSDTWTIHSSLGEARAFHRAFVGPDDQVFVHGGVGYNPTQTGTPLAATLGLWPGNSLSTCETFDAQVGRWSSVGGSSIRRSGHVLKKIDANRVVALAGQCLVQSGIMDDTGHVEIFDLRTRAWTKSPAVHSQALGLVSGEVSDLDVVVYGGFADSGATHVAPVQYVDGSPTSGRAINGFHRVTAPTSTTLTFQDEAGWASDFGTKHFTPHGLRTRTLSGLRIVSGTRTAGVTTLTLTVPAGFTGHNIAVGDEVYVNSEAPANFGGGYKTIIATTSTTISYAEVGSNPLLVFAGSVSQKWDIASVEKSEAITAPLNNPGPYVFDAQGLAVTGRETVNDGWDIYEGLNYAVIQLDDTAGFSNNLPSEGWICISFGTSKQTPAIKYHSWYKNTPTTLILNLDFSYIFTSTHLIGAKVTYLAQRQPLEAQQLPGSAYLTGSSVGRVAAEVSTKEAAAAGIDVDVTVVYPGDRGIAGEGLPHKGEGKLSDIVSVFAGDEDVQN